MSTRPVVLLTRRIGVPTADDAIDRDAEVIVAASPAVEDVAAAIAPAEGMIAIRPTVVTRDIIAAAPNLRVISALGSGCDHVDVDAATEFGVAVTSGAGVAAGAVAEFALGSMVAAHREFLSMHLDLVAGRPWGEIKGSTIGAGLEGNTLGVIGFGKIGRLVAERAVAGFGAQVLVYDPFLDVSTLDLPEGITVVTSLMELVERSLTVTVHVPLTKDTEGLLGAAELAALGSAGILIQASRGGVVDEAALVQALEAGTIKGAVIDVFEVEPPAPNLIAALAATNRVLLTPHMASFTHRAIDDLAHAAVADVLAVLNGTLPASVVNRADLRPANGMTS